MKRPALGLSGGSKWGGGQKGGFWPHWARTPHLAPLSRGDYARNERIKLIPSPPDRFRDIEKIWIFVSESTGFFPGRRDFDSELTGFDSDLAGGYASEEREGRYGYGGAYGPLWAYGLRYFPLPPPPLLVAAHAGGAPSGAKTPALDRPDRDGVPPSREPRMCPRQGGGCPD